MSNATLSPVAYQALDDALRNARACAAALVNVEPRELEHAATIADTRKALTFIASTLQELKQSARVIA